MADLSHSALGDLQESPGQEQLTIVNSEYLDLINTYHAKSGLSLREVAQACDLDPSYIHYVLQGKRRPRRDVIIALGFAYGLERIEVDEILLLAKYPPIGKHALRDYRKAQDKSK